MEPRLVPGLGFGRTNSHEGARLLDNWLDDEKYGHGWILCEGCFG